MMKKYLRTALIFAVAALAAGVFYREFTKLNGFTGRTSLAFVHTHLFILGTGVYLFAAVFTRLLPSLHESRAFSLFEKLHPAALIFFTVMLGVRGIIQTAGIHVNDAAVAGIAGLSHILIAVSLTAFLWALYKEGGREK